MELDENYRSVGSIENQIKLQKACLSGNVDEIKEFIVDPNEVFADSRTPLFYAVESQKIEAVALILSLGGNPQIIDEDGTTPLHLASHELSIKMLLEHGADPNAQMRSGATPLILLAQHGHTELVQILLEHPKCDPSIRDVNGASAIYFAAKNGHEKILDLLLQRTHDDIDKYTAKGSWPLHAACVKGYGLAVEILLKYKANPQQATKEGKSLIAICAEEKHLDIIEILLNQLGGSAYFTQSKTNSFWPIWLASARGYFDLTHRLVELGANPKEMLGQAGATPIHFAAHFLNLKAIDILLSIDSSLVHLQDFTGATPLFYACQKYTNKQCIPVVSKLVNTKSINAVALLRPLTKRAPPQSIDDIQPAIQACFFITLLAPLDLIPSSSSDLSNMLIAKGARRRKHHILRFMHSNSHNNHKREQEKPISSNKKNFDALV